MISNHYAMTYGARDNWLVLIAMSFAGASIRAWFVARHKPEGRHGLKAALPAALGALTLVGLVVVLAPNASSVAVRGAAAVPAPTGGEIEAIVQERCVQCHSQTPSPEFGFSAPPSGVMFDTLNELRAHRANVQVMLSSRAMPPGNVTGLTDEERAEILMWIAHGARP
jgi:uncharacterized membrane protein